MIIDQKDDIVKYQRIELPRVSQQGSEESWTESCQKYLKKKTSRDVGTLQKDV